MIREVLEGQWFEGRSLGWRLSLLALVFGVLVAGAGAIELLRERTAFEREMREATQALRIGLSTTLEVTEREMLHIASLLAVDPEVKYYMKRAHEVVALGQGEAEGVGAAALRESFAARMQSRYENHWAEELATRKVEFHLLPGAVNFLRLADPRRFGDRLDDERPMVALTHELGIPSSGFEVGRMYAGLRGLHPITASGAGGVSRLIGSVEVGVAMSDLLTHATSRFGAEFLLALPRDLVDDVMWRDDIRATLNWSELCGCYINAPDHVSGAALIDALADPAAVPLAGHRLVTVGDKWYAVTRVDLTSFFDRVGSDAQGGKQASVFIFSDRSEVVGTYRNGRVRVLFVLITAYAIAMLLGWIILRRVDATQAALDTARRFRSALFSLAPDSVLVADRNGVIVEVNPRFCEVTGYTAEEVIGRNARILQSGETSPETYDSLWATLLAGDEWRGDLLNRRKDGSLYWEAHAIVPVRDARGEISLFVSFQRDISERREMERALGASERLYRSIFENVEEAIFLMRVEPDDFVFVGNNPQHERATGLTSERLYGARPGDILPPESAAAVSANYRRCVNQGQTIRYEEILDLPAGRRHWLTSLTPVRSDGGEIDLIVGLAVDVTKQKATESELRRLATTDGLTGLANRRHFLDRAAQELGRVRRYDKPAAFMMLDVDHFKRINDTWGHATGDAVLRNLAGVLTGAVRETDLVGRLGGEEFGVLLPETEMEAALALAERLREAVIAETVDVEGDVLRFSASFGVTVLHADDESVDMAMARADAALYAAKFAGRNRVKWRAR